jgi:hypothetical protein
MTEVEQLQSEAISRRVAGRTRQYTSIRITEKQLSDRFYDRDGLARTRSESSSSLLAKKDNGDN